jgi:hypothetical protein
MPAILMENREKWWLFVRLHFMQVASGLPSVPLSQLGRGHPRKKMAKKRELNFRPLLFEGTTPNYFGML